jgi:hypothetical protein
MSGTLKVGGKTLATHDTNTNVAKIQLGSTSDVVLTDSSGNNVLSESGGVVTLAQDIVTGTSSYGFAQLKLTENKILGNITWDTITGDTTNFTKPSSNHLIQLGIAGIYIINASVSMVLSGDERNIGIELFDNSGPTVLSHATDQIVYLEGTSSYGGASLTYTGYFPANSQIYFTTSSANQGNATVYISTHASICLIRKTA